MFNRNGQSVYSIMTKNGNLRNDNPILDISIPTVPIPMPVISSNGTLIISNKSLKASPIMA